MDSLRWMLLGGGILLVVVIYFWESWRGRERDYRQGELDVADEELLHSLETERDAGLHGHLNTDLDDLVGLKGERGGNARLNMADIPPMQPESNAGMPEIGFEKGAVKVKEDKSRISSLERRPGDNRPELVIVFNVMAGPGRNFAGDKIRAALEEVDMVFGEMRIFHHYGVGELNAKTPVFSIANIVEPGFFDLERMEELETPGLCFFLRLPGPLDGKVAFELMLNTGQRLAEKLVGELRDETRSVVTMQTLFHLRDRITEFGRQQLLDA